LKVVNSGENEGIIASPPIYDIETGQTPLQSPSTDGSCPYVVSNLRFVMFGPRPKQSVALGWN